MINALQPLSKAGVYSFFKSSPLNSSNELSIQPHCVSIECISHRPIAQKRVEETKYYRPTILSWVSTENGTHKIMAFSSFSYRRKSHLKWVETPKHHNRPPLNGDLFDDRNCVSNNLPFGNNNGAMCTTAGSTAASFIQGADSWQCYHEWYRPTVTKLCIKSLFHCQISVISWLQTMWRHRLLCVSIWKLRVTSPRREFIVRMLRVLLDCSCSRPRVPLSINVYMFGERLLVIL